MTAQTTITKPVAGVLTLTGDRVSIQTVTTYIQRGLTAAACEVQLVIQEPKRCPYTLSIIEGEYLPATVLAVGFLACKIIIYDMDDNLLDTSDCLFLRRALSAACGR